MPPYRNYIYEYHAKITSGEIIAGKWIKKIYEIIINGLQKQEYFFNAKAANKAIRFIENFCHHSKGRNDLIKLELWQKAIVSVIFGIQDAEKIRIFREIFIVIGRKNGKSLFASAIIAYMAYLEPEYGQEIYCLAPKLDQAALVYDGFYQMVQAQKVGCKAVEWLDELTLIAETTAENRVNKNGFAVAPEENARTVFCNKKSVGYSEYFKSQQTGKLVEAKYEVHKADYGGEDVVEVNGRRYFVLKTYDTGTDTIELTLTDLRHRNEV